MEKIKYVIIFTLVLGLGLLYLQINDYDNITNTLLQDSKSSQKNKLSFQKQILALQTKNIEYIDKISKLETNSTELNNKINILQKQIILLEKNLFLYKTNIVEKKYTEQTDDLNLTQEILMGNTNNYNHEDNENNTSTLKPNITIDEENKITGFGLDYSQKF